MLINVFGQWLNPNQIKWIEQLNNDGQAKVIFGPEYEECLTFYQKVEEVANEINLRSAKNGK